MIDREYIEELIIRYYNNELSDTEKQELLSILQDKPEFLEEFRKAKNIDDSIFQSLNKINFDHKKAYNKFQNSILYQSKKKSNKKIKVLSTWIAAAAVIIIGLILFIPQKPNEILLATVEKQNISLPDGSEIALNEHSKITYPEKFKKERKIQFEGEGFFEIKSIPEKPFIIEMDKIEIQVKGTSFNILQDTIKGFIKITVKTGIVNVLNKLNNDTLPVKEGELFEYTYGTNTIMKKINFDENYNSWNTGILIFRETSMDKVINDLNKYYKVNFKIENESIRNCKLDTRIDNVNFDEVIQMLEFVLDVQISKENNDYLIKGEGC